MKGINDGGKREQYGENGAMREPSTGKGRYDLISPFMLEELAKWLELGAKKYSRAYQMNTNEILQFIEKEVEQCNNVLYVESPQFIAKKCVEIVMKKIYERETPNFTKDKNSIQENGEKISQIIAGTKQEEENKKTQLKKQKENVKHICDNEDLQKKVTILSNNGKIIPVCYAEEVLKKSGQSILTMTIRQEKQEVYCVVVATTDLECLRNLLTICKKLLITLKVPILKNLENGMIEVNVSGDRNWEKGGIPFSRYFDSALRHLIKFQMGMEDENHLAAAIFNIMAIIHFRKLGLLDDDNMPHYLEGK